MTADDLTYVLGPVIRRSFVRTTNRAALGFGAVAFALSLTYPWISDESVTAAIAALIGIGTCAATAVGPRLNAVQDRRGWRLLSLAALAFIIGLVVHPWTATLPGALRRQRVAS